MSKPRHLPVTTPGSFDSSRSSRQLMTVQDVADALRLSKKSVYVLIERGELACFRLGSRIRISGPQVDDYLQRCLGDLG